jgi:O-succinylbenzoic acid--CoA ligase
MAAGRFTPLTLRMARERPTRPALIWRDQVTTYEELEHRVRRAAGYLRRKGVMPGDVVAVWADTSPEWVAIAHAVSRLHATLLPLNTRLTVDELIWQLDQAEARFLLTDSPSTALSRSFKGTYCTLSTCHDEDLVQDLSDGIDYSSISTILFTSGTTGRPKAAMLSWANQLASAEASSTVLQLGAQDRWHLALPLFHVGGLNILHRCAHVGATVVMQDRFEVGEALDLFERWRVTITSVVPTVLRRIKERLGDRPLPDSLRAMLVGGAAASEDLLASFPQALPTYGLTETCSHVTLARPGAAIAPGSATPPLPGTEVRIVSAEGDPLPMGLAGLIEVRGATVFQGYLGHPRRRATDWFRTGDIGELDAAGRLVVHSRRSDLIVSGGENVYPAEVEAALEAHPAIREAAVVGVPDPEWGQVPWAFVVRHDPDLAEVAIRRFLGERLARYKHPRRFLFVPELPRLANGKVARAQLARDVEHLQAAPQP